MTVLQKLEKAEALIKEFQAMRLLQKKYFKSRFDDPTKSADYLKQSKAQESKVDIMIGNYLDPQQSLF